MQQQQSLLARKRRPARLVPLALATRSSSPATSTSSYRRVLALEPRYSLWPCLASFLASPHHVEYSTSCKPAFLCAAVVRCIRAASLRMCARSSPSPFERSSFGRFTRLCAARHHCGVAVSERQHVSLGWEVPFVLLKPQTLQTVRCQAPPWPTICVRVCACTLVPRVLGEQRRPYCVVRPFVALLPRLPAMPRCSCTWHRELERIVAANFMASAGGE